MDWDSKDIRAGRTIKESVMTVYTFLSNTLIELQSVLVAK